MDWEAIFHWVYVAAMVIGALHFWSLSRKDRGVPQVEPNNEIKISRITFNIFGYLKLGGAAIFT